MSALVEVDCLVKRFRSITAVNGISFKVERGEVLGFLGPNGAGKSTTMKMIAGFLTADEGSIRIKGEDCSRHPVASKRLIGYLPEGAPLYGDMSPRLFLRFAGEIRGLRGTELEERVAGVVDSINLHAVVDQPIETLSKGFKRRVGIAQALLHDPEVLILDEPTDGLDPNQKHEVRNLIREMSPQKAIILSTHILEEVDAVCGRAIIIAGGEIVADGNPAELEASSPEHNTVSMMVRGATREGITSVLAGLPDVTDVRAVDAEEGATRFVIRPKVGATIAASLGDAAKEHGWTVEELRVERGRLDEVFRRATQAHRT
jgi:ABC-2 type transport system ATP-binding protein